MLGGAGDGWFSLQDRLFRAWAKRGKRWTIHYIKEKFAALDMNASSPDDSECGFRDMRYIEVASERVCEICGAPGCLAGTPIDWLYTRCERHLASRVAKDDTHALRCLPDFECIEQALEGLRGAAPDPRVPPDATWLAIDEPSCDGSLAQCLDRALVWIIESRDRLLSRSQLSTYLPGSLVRDLIAGLGHKEHLPTSKAVDWITDRLHKTRRRLAAFDESPRWMILNFPEPFHIPW
jgi:hypothetical protein